MFTMPDYAPLYDALPITAQNCIRFSVYSRAKEGVLASLMPKELKPVGNTFETFFMEVPQTGSLEAYLETGIVVPCEYNGDRGGHVTFEYVTTDEALCAGREIWGYPKKIAEISGEFGPDYVKATASRKGDLLMSGEFIPQDECEFDIPQMLPRYLVRRIPEADGTRRDQIVRNSWTPGGDATRAKRVGTATLAFGGELAPLADSTVIGAVCTLLDYTLTYGEILAEL